MRLLRLIPLGVLAIACVATAADKPGVAPRSPKEEQATFQLLPGMCAELVASEPDIIDPVAMCFDHRGRIFVCEMRGYPNGGVGTGNETRGRIRLLTDKDGDGIYETSQIYAEGLRFPMGVTPWRNGVLVAVAPDIIYLEDTNDDGISDKKTVLYSGFHLSNIQQMVNGLQWFYDGWIHGIAGTPGGVVVSPQVPGKAPVELRSRGFRFKPDVPGSLEPISGGGQYGISSDEYGHWFTNTNSQHLRQIVLRDEYARRNPNLILPPTTVDIPDHGAACKVYRLSPFEAWRVERTTRRAGSADAKRFSSTELVPGGFITSGCSAMVYTSGLFPGNFQGSVLGCDPANNLIHRDMLDGSGTIFVAKRVDKECEFLASSDNWFRPVQVSTGPDGAVYVLDFYREAIETPLSLPDDIKAKMNLESRERGRIWRIKPSGTKYAPVKIDAENPAALVKQLSSPNAWVRLTAQRLLFEKQPDIKQPLQEQFAKAKGTPTLPVVLGTLQMFGVLTDEHLLTALADPISGNREVALRMSEPRLMASAKLVETAAKLAKDPVAMVRFQLGMTIGAAPESARLAVLAQLLDSDGSDTWMQTAVLCSTGKSISPLIAAVIKHGANSPASRAFLLRAATLSVSNPDELAAVAKMIPASKTVGMTLIEGLGQGLKTRGSGLSVWLKNPPKGLESVADEIRKQFAEAAVAAGKGDLASLRLMAYAPFDVASPVLSSHLTPQTPAEVQLAAVRSLGAQLTPEVSAILLKGWKGYAPSVRREVVEQLLSRVDRTTSLLNAIERKDLQANELDPVRVVQLKQSTNKAIAARAAKLFGAATSASRKSIIDDYLTAESLKGNAEKGKMVFKTQCAACHKLGNEGHDVGPNLLAVVPGKSFADLVTSVMDPNREVDPRYFNYQVNTLDGRTMTGIIVSETSNAVTLRRNDGAEDVIRRVDLEALRSTGLSLMPEGMEKQVSKQDFVDLLAFLKETTSKTK